MKTYKTLNENLKNWFSKSHPDGDWKRIDSKGNVIGPCARKPGEPKPKCMSKRKRQQLSKKERAAAVAAKRRHDPNPEGSGKAINVSNFGKGKLSEEKKTKSFGKTLMGAAVIGGMIGYSGAQIRNASMKTAGQDPIYQVQVSDEPQQQPQNKPELTPQKVYHHDAIKQMVIHDEGIRTKPYKDTRGILTVGIGHNLETPQSNETFRKAFGDNGDYLHAHVKKGGSLSKDQVIQLFNADYDEHLNRTIKMIPNLHEHPPDVQAALVSGTYRGHIGDSPTFRKHFNSGNYKAASKEFLNRSEYKNPAKKSDGSLVAPGVKDRLERDHKIFSNYADTK